jgi:DNA excision repair protein ERCC-4
MGSTTPVILIDSREQKPLVLPNSRRATLPTGDYSIGGLEHLVAVERKSLEDLYGCFGQSRDRFERELVRLAEFPYPAIVIEASMIDVLQGTKYSRVNPMSAIGSLIAWGTKFRIPVWLAGDRRMAAGTVRKILYAAVKYIEETNGAK